MYLLDTNVVSELRRTRPHGGALAWMSSVATARIFVSAVSIGEIQVGIEVTRRQDEARAEELEAWLDGVLDSYEILPMDSTVFRECARLIQGRPEAWQGDAMIAATAVVHGLTVVTRNVSDFARFGVELLNPFETGRPLA